MKTILFRLIFTCLVAVGVLHAASAAGESIIPLNCRAIPRPMPVRPCGGCEVVKIGNGQPDDLRVLPGSRLQWRSAHPLWKVRFTGASPCTRHSFDRDYPGCKVTAAAGIFAYSVKISNCRDADGGRILVETRPR